ncbi:MAG TPA: DUF2723 domain-containing protein [Blastocatellia bacterium]|nr:DUF2723 domain-containing protein [Blastocatellia bacterium]
MASNKRRRDSRPQRYTGSVSSTVSTGSGTASVAQRGFDAPASYKGGAVALQGMLARPRTRLASATFVSAIILIVYLLTLAPTVTLVDSGELIVAARFLGVAHPPGFPLYVMMAHLATLLPFGNVAQRVNFADALFASIASGLTCLALAEAIITPGKSYATKDKKRRQKAAAPDSNSVRELPVWTTIAIEVVPPICGGLFLGFCRTLWGYGTIAEVYTINTMLVVSIYFLMIRWRRRILESRLRKDAEKGASGSIPARPSNKWSINRADIPLYTAALIFGLALGVHHVTVGLNLLALGGFVLLTEGWRFFISPRLLYAFLVSVCGLGVYAYLPLAASRHPVLNWGDPVTLNRLWLHITGWQYQVFLKGGDVVSLAKQFVLIAGREFGPPWAPVTLLLAVAGVIALIRERNTPLVVFLVLIFAADLGYGLSYEIAEDKDAYYLPIFIVIALAAGFGVRLILQLLVSVFKASVVKAPGALAAAAAAMLVFPAVTLGANYHYNDRSRYFIAHDYVDNIFKTAGQGGMLLTLDWQVYSPMMYVREVEHERRDVRAIDVNLLRRSWYYGYLATEYPDLMRETRAQVDSFLEDLRAWEKNPSVYQTDVVLNRRISDRFDQMILAFVSYNLKTSPVYLTEDIALDFGNENPGLASAINKTYQLVPQGLVFEVEPDHNFHEPAHPEFSTRGLFDGSIAFDPDDVVEQKVAPAYLNMIVNRGRYLQAYGRNKEAVESCQEALKLQPDFAPAKTLLGECLSAVDRQTSPTSAVTAPNPASKPSGSISPSMVQ